MRRRKRILFILFTAFCAAVFYGYMRGKEDTASRQREVNVFGHKFPLDRFEEAPYDFINREPNSNGIGEVEKHLKARQQPGVVEWADPNDRQNSGGNGIDGNDAFISDTNSGNVVKGNRKKFLEPISLKPQDLKEQQGGNNAADIVQIQNQENNLHNGAQKVHIKQEPLNRNAAPPGFDPPKNGPAPPGVREDQQRLQRLQQELEDRQREVQRHQEQLRQQNDKMQQMQQQQQQQNEQWKKQQEDHQKQLEILRQQQLNFHQQLQQQNQQGQQEIQPAPPQPQQAQFQPQPQQQFQPQFQPQQQPQFQPQQQPQFQPQQQPQFQPQQQQPQFQPQQQQPQFQPQPQQPGQFQPQQANQQAVVGNQQQQQQPVNIGMQNNQGAPPMNQGGQQPSGDDFLKNLLKDKIHLSVVCCGDRLEETTIMLKSATIFTQTPMHFHIFAEDQLHEDMANKLNSWPATFRRKFSFNIYPITFPPGEDPAEWKKVFKLCATQRLFLPDLLMNVDSVLYVDTDILFMRPLEKIWHFFKEFNSTQFAAMTPEHEIANIGWYNRFGRHPYYGLTGLNSGVMLMNLTRMRSFGWTNRIVPLYREYKTKITWGDQDLINILFHFHPEGVYVYPCEWNFRPDACMYSLNCHRIKDHGVSIIHGNRGVYHNDKQLPFRAIYEAFRSYEFGADLETGLVQGIKQRFSNPNLMSMYCTKALSTPLINTLHESTNMVNGLINSS